MLLTSLKYEQHEGTAEHWRLKEVKFDHVTLITGLNATGKTRVVNILCNVAKELSVARDLLNGNWALTFTTSDGTALSYQCKIANRRVEEENLKLGSKSLLERAGDNGRIFDELTGNWQDYGPPDDKLTPQVRRDKKQYPHLEEIVGWARAFHGYAFSKTPQSEHVIGSFRKAKANTIGPDSINLATNVFKEMQDKDPAFETKIIRDMRKLHFQLDQIKVGEIRAEGIPLGAFSIVLKEKKVPSELNQSELSAGMYRALCTIILANYVQAEKGSGVLAIDDLGEGLDLGRSQALVKLLIEKAQAGAFQLIMTTNDRHLMNVVDLKYWNVLERDGKVVTSYNYSNCRNRFEAFLTTGLTNFDLFKDKLYKPVVSRN